MKNNKEYGKLVTYGDGSIKVFVNGPIYDRKTVFKIVSRNGLKLKYLPQYSDDREIVLHAISNNPKSLCYASERLQDDKEVVVYAMSLDFTTYFYASDRLQSDTDINNLFNSRFDMLKNQCDRVYSKTR